MHHHLERPADHCHNQIFEARVHSSIMNPAEVTAHYLTVFYGRKHGVVLLQKLYASIGFFNLKLKFTL